MDSTTEPRPRSALCARLLSALAGGAWVGVGVEAWDIGRTPEMRQEAWMQRPFVLLLLPLGEGWDEGLLLEWGCGLGNAADPHPCPLPGEREEEGGDPQASLPTDC